MSWLTPPVMPKRALPTSFSRPRLPSTVCRMRLVGSAGNDDRRGGRFRRRPSSRSVPRGAIVVGEVEVERRHRRRPRHRRPPRRKSSCGRCRRRRSSPNWLDQSEAALRRSVVSDSTAAVPSVLELAFDVAVTPCSSVGFRMKVPNLMPGAAKGLSSAGRSRPSIASARSAPGSSGWSSSESIVGSRTVPVGVSSVSSAASAAASWPRRARVSAAVACSSLSAHRHRRTAAGESAAGSSGRRAGARRRHRRGGCVGLRDILAREAAPASRHRRRPMRPAAPAAFLRLRRAGKRPARQPLRPGEGVQSAQAGTCSSVWAYRRHFDPTDCGRKPRHTYRTVNVDG